MKSLGKLACDLESYYGVCPKRADEIKVWTRIPFKRHLPTFLFQVHSNLATDDWIQITFWFATFIAIYELSIEVIEMYKLLKNKEYLSNSWSTKLLEKFPKDIQRNTRLVIAVGNILVNICLLFGTLTFRSGYNLIWIYQKLILIPMAIISLIIYDRKSKDLIFEAFWLIQFALVCHVTMIIWETTFKIFD